MTDYTAMSSAEMVNACADNAQKWAEAFMQVTGKYPLPVSEADMIGWFANAIEQGHAVRRWKVEKPVAYALEVIERYGGIDGQHHKTWVIDQVARMLTGDGYNEWVREMKDGEDGPETYDWDTGIAP